MADRDSTEIPDAAFEPTRRMTEQEREARPADDETVVRTPSDRAATPPLLAAGQQLAGRFRIVRRLGHGGMGEVYEAEDHELGETVALKTVLPGIARDPDALRRFNREIHLARKVTHPNVCRIFDVFHDRVETDGGKVQEITFFTMELLPGETLEQRLRRQGRMGTGKAGPIARQIVEGLAAAHQAGVIHRDFKTANVMLVPGPGGVRAVITDFGLARAGIDDEAAGGTLTVLGDVLGSPLYMAPEQVTAGEITTATDVYTLGLVLYEMVTGRPPFVGDSVMATMLKRLQEPPPPPRLAAPDLDPAWNAAILRCLEIKPADRFKDVRDVLAALGGAAIEPGPRRKQLARRRWLLAAAGLAVVVLLAVLWLLRPTGKVVGERPAVAVLGFKNLSEDPGVDFIEGTLLSWLPDELCASGKLRPVPDETVERVKRERKLRAAAMLSPETLELLHKNLGADLVVLGSYYAHPGRPVQVKVNVQRAPSGEVLTTVSEEGSEQDLSPMISRLGTRLRTRLGVSELSPAEAQGVRASRPSSGKATRFYAAALSRLRVLDFLAARDLFRRAVEAEPDYPLAHSGLAKALQELGYDRQATEEAKLAFDHSGRLPEEEKLQVEAQYREAAGQLRRAIEIYSQLGDRFPDVLEYGLRLAELQTKADQGKAALATVASLRALPPPAGDDPRLDLAEAAADASLSLFERQRALAETAEKKGRRQEAHLLVAEALLEQGSACTSTAQHQKALDVFERARQIYARVGDDAALARTLGEKGDVFINQGNYGAALRLHEEALAVFQRLGYRAGEAAQRNRIGSILDKQGESAQAMAAWERAVAIREEIGESAAEPLNNMAILLTAQGKLSEARQRYEQLLADYRSTGDRRSEEVVLGNLADVLRSQGELARAKETFEKALAIAREVGDRSGIGYLLSDLARVLVTQGDLDQAWQKNQEALQLRIELGEKGTVAESRLAMAGLLLEKGDPGQARSLAEQALTQFRAESLTKEEAQARAVLARALAAQGSLAKAQEEISSAEALAAKSESAVLRMTVQLAAGQVREAAGEVAEARRLLAGVRDQARSSGFVGLELDARLELGRLEAEHGDRAQGRALLAAVEKEARARGFGRVAGQARALSRGLPK